MNYEKPEVVARGSAIAAIQETGSTNKQSDPNDSDSRPSDPAYQADE